MNETRKLDLAFFGVKAKAVEQCKTIAENPDAASAEVMLALYKTLCDYSDLLDEVRQSMQR